MASLGYGASIEIDDGATSTFVPFDDVTMITVPSQEVATVESTHLLSPGRYREYISGLQDAGKWGFTMRWSDDSYDRVHLLKGVTHAWKIKFPDTSVATFDSFITLVEQELTFDAVTDIKVSAQVSGVVTYTLAV